MTGSAFTRRAAGALLVFGGLASGLSGERAFAASDTGRWRVAESPRFRVYSEGNADALKAFAGQLESFDWALRLLHGLDPDELPLRKLDIYIVPSLSRLRVIWPGAGEGIRGFYTSNPEDIFAVSFKESVADTKAKRDPNVWSESYLFHEYTHHFMLQYFPFAYPAWLVEGYAEYFGTTTIDGPVIEFGKFDIGRVQELRETAWVPMETLLGKRVSEIPTEKRSTYYAQAWWLTHYMREDTRRAEQLRAYMTAVGKGGDPVEEMVKATGQSLDALQKALWAELSHEVTYHRITRTKALPTSEITVTPLNAAADDLLLLNQRLRAGVASSEGPAFIAEVRRRTAAWPADGLAQRLLARSEVEFGDRAAGKAAADRRLAAVPDDVEMLEIAAQARLDEADTLTDPAAARALAIEAQPFLGRAYKLDGHRYQTLAMYARCRKRLDAPYPLPNTLTALTSALHLAPQVKEIRFEAVRALMLVKRWDEAEAELAPLINDPHSAAYSDAAKKLLAEIRAGKAAEAGKPASP